MNQTTSFAFFHRTITTLTYQSFKTHLFCFRDESEKETVENDCEKSEHKKRKNNASITLKHKSVPLFPSASGGESSTSDLSDQEVSKGLLSETSKKNKKKRSKTQQQSRLRPVSISDASGTDEQAQQHLNSRAKSVDTSIMQNDLAPPLNYNLKSLSVEHRLLNASQMSISSTLSKTNSMKYNNNKANCVGGTDTPIHAHSTTPTPRESVVFNRGDEKPISKILQQKTSMSVFTGTHFQGKVQIN
jgi:hypothetical protein